MDLTPERLAAVIGGRQENSWSPTVWARHLRRAPLWTVGVADQHIVLMTPDGVRSIHVVDHEQISVVSGLLWARLLAPELGVVTPLVGLKKRAAAEFRYVVLEQLSDYEWSVDLEPARQAIADWWPGFRDATQAAWSRRRWLTEEFIQLWESKCADLMSTHRLSAAQLRLLLTRAGTDEAEGIELASTPGALRLLVGRQNQALVEVELREHRDFFQRIEKSPLTDEQSRAVICFDNRVQLVAAAGSGKTSTIVAKAAYTIRKGIAAPEEILLLAFNRAAAEELAERCIGQLRAAGLGTGGLTATTFHTFGLRIIGEATGQKPRLAAGLDRDNGLVILNEVVGTLRRQSPAFASKWSLFQNVLGVPFAGEVDETPDAWDPTNRRSGFRALDYNVLKSAGERAIANWLIKCGVEFEYERSYEVGVADDRHSQYHPDFFYPAANLYHEHWAFVPGQAVPESFAGYLESSAWKKHLHASHGTTLIETAAKDLADGSLFETLERELRSHGINAEFDPDRPTPGSPLLTDREMLTLFRTFLSHAKSNRLSDADLRARVRRRRGGAPDLRESQFLDLFADVHAAWDRRLRDDNEVDFEDMLNHATDLIEAGKWETPFKVVLVDEFQDASRARARLVSALVSGTGRYLFAVGDDWQSIYRFAGSDITAMTKFESIFGKGHSLRLERTFRSPQELCDVAGDFVMRNPTQFRKRVVSDRSMVAPVSLAVVGSDDEISQAIEAHLRVIAARLDRGERASVKILGRYRHEAELVPSGRSFPNLDVGFQTIHSSKGLEADHVIVPGLNRGAFPSTKEDDPLLRLALPAGDEFPHAEERRLFYVALTRARETVLLIARKGRESEFLAELIESGAVRIESNETGVRTPVVCPSCGKGLMVERQGHYGPFLACNRYPACATTQRIGS